MNDHDDYESKRDEWELVAQAFASADGVGWIRATCALCEMKTGKADAKASLGYNTATGGYNCLAAETKVLTWDGYRQIGDLVGQTCRLLAVGADGISRWVDAPIERFGYQRLLRLIIQRTQIRKSIRVTPLHRWFVRSNEKYVERFTSELEVGDRLRSVVFPRSGTIRPSPWGIAHGFTFGDGTRLLREDKGSRAYFCGEKDRAMLRFFPLSAAKKDGEGRIRVEGLPKFFKRLPDLDEASSYLYGWLSGYFAADGCVDSTGMPTMASADRKTLEFVRRVCIRLGIFTYGIREQVREGFGVVSSLYSLSFSRRSLNQEFFCVPAHRERWLANHEVRERVGWVVSSVEDDCDQEEVFCATVEGFGNFTLEDNLLTGNCFKCGTTGKLPASYRDRMVSGDITSAPVVEKPADPVEIAEGFFPLYSSPGAGASILDWARDYLEKKRGLLAGSCCAAGVGAAFMGKLAGRVIVPLHDYKLSGGSPWRGWVARDTTGKSSLTYRYSRGLKRDGYVYNEPALYELRSKPVFVVEGTLDAIALWPDAVAVLGKPLDSQLGLFRAATRPVVIALDGDAWEEGWALAMKLRFLGVRAGAIRLDPKQDPDEVDRMLLDEAARTSLFSLQAVRLM